MRGKPLTDEEIKARLDAVQKYGTYATAGDALGISEAGIRRAIREGVKRNLTGDFQGSTLPPGYVMGKVTSLVGPNGTVMEWQHKLPEIEALEETIDQLIEQMRAEITPLPTHEIDATFDPDVLTLYPVVDVHLGMHAWKAETGNNYDLKIATREFKASVGQLFVMTPMSGTALIVVLGDFFHADDNDAVTRHSKHHLDVDGRIDKVLHIGAGLIVWTIDMALQKHERVIVHICRGNHDPYASKALTLALSLRYENNPRVQIDISPVDMWSYQHGEVMLSFTHGDNIKAEEMPGRMAAMEPTMWGATKHRYAFSGHYHKSKKGPHADESNGARWEILPAFTAKDAWSYSMRGFTSLREIVAITFNKKLGRRMTANVVV